MGGNMVMVGDFVTRKSYNNDIVFRVIDIQGDAYYLCGVSIRLFADSSLDDLVICNGDTCEDEFNITVSSIPLPTESVPFKIIFTFLSLLA